MTNGVFTVIAILLLSAIKMEADPIPFRLVSNTILIEATVNNISGYFIVDTGTPYLVLNEEFFKGVPTNDKIRGLVGGEMDLYKQKVDLMIGDLKWNRVEAILLSLDHLSRLKGVTILGLIGTKVLKYFEMTIDFDTLELELNRAFGRSNSENTDYPPDAAFEFYWRGGMPTITTEVGNNNLVFGLDTGAGINVLDSHKGKQLTEFLTTGDKVKLFGLASESQNMQSGLIHNVIIENYYCPEMKVVLTSLKRFKGVNSELNAVDGLLGYEFLKQFRSVINFKKNTISLYYRNHRSEKYIVAR